MIDLFEQIPGWLVRHWFIGAIGLVLFLAVAYYVVLKIAFGIEDVKDVKRRNPDR